MIRRQSGGVTRRQVEVTLLLGLMVLMCAIFYVGVVVTAKWVLS